MKVQNRWLRAVLFGCMLLLLSACAPAAQSNDTADPYKSEAPPAQTEQQVDAGTEEKEPEQAVPETENAQNVVYITESGQKFHRGTCRHLKDSKIEISLEEALAKGYEACGTCKPKK